MCFSKKRRNCYIGFALSVLSILLSTTIADTIPKYDFNDDTKVDILDLSILAGSWLQNNPVTDIYPFPSGDGVVNLGDFSEFAKYWPAQGATQSSPYEQFAKESKTVESVLTSMQDAVNNNQNIAVHLAQLQESKTRIEQVSQDIQDKFQETFLRCQTNNLDPRIIERCISAEQSFLETKELLINSILTVLNADEVTLPAVIPAILDIFTSLKLNAEPDFHNSQPTLWEIQSPQDVPSVEYDETLPAIDVMAQAAASPPVAMDLMETYDVQITDEIVAEANELNYSPSAMYEYVRNNFKFQPYYGSRKGSVETFRQRGGNDYDLATTLIALLRASGINARYASGIVEMPVDRAKSWLGVEDGQVAGSILYTNGLEGIYVTNPSGEEIVAVRCRRVWVEAYVSRGRGGKAWIPLDPAFKLHEIQQGQDIPEIMNFDAQAFLDEYYAPTDPGVTLPRPETILELYKQEIADYLAVNDPNATVESVKRKQTIISENLGLLPASLPYKVLSRDGNFSEIPDNKVYKIRFHIKNGGTTLIDQTLNLPEIAGKRVTINYVAASPADQAAIDSYGGIYQTPPYLVSLKPVLRVDGQDMAVGTSGVGMGRSHSSDIYFISPVNGQGYPQNVVPAIYNDMTCGASVAVAIGTGGYSEAMLVEPPDDDTEGMAQLLYNTAIDYLSMCHNADMEFAELMHCFVTNDVADAIVENVVNVTYDMYGTPQTFNWVSMRVDADRSVMGIWSVDQYGNDAESKDMMILAGSEGSLYENRIFENSYEQDAVSTIKILQLAKQQGVTVYKRWSTLPLPTNSLPTSARTAIQNAISGGHVVTFPAAQIIAGTPSTGQWTGAGWIDMDPETGAAGYIISGNNNGGVTVDKWPPETIDLLEGDRDVTLVVIDITKPGYDSPQSGDAIFARSDNQYITFEYRIHVFYDDGTDKWLPGTFSRTTHYTTKEFFPDHYWFSIWVSRWPFWGCLGWAERKISIVGVYIAGDDGSEYGVEPPKYLPVKPASGTVPSEKFKAVVVPTDLATAGSYSWSNGSKLKVLSNTSQITDVEPASPTPSGALNDQNLDAELHVSGGPVCKTDQPHKMTVYNVEFKADDGTSDPPKYVPINHKQELKAVVTPSSVSGKFNGWSTSSDKISLDYSWWNPWGIWGKEATYVEADISPSDNIDDEEIMTKFDAEGTSKEFEFGPHKMTVVNVELEPVTIEPGGGSTFPLNNPSGIENGKTASYEIKVEPVSVVPDSEISWKVTNGGVSFSGSEKGRTVNVKGNSNGAAKLEVEIGKATGDIPTVEMNVLTKNIVDVYVYIIRKDDGTGAAWTEGDVTAFLNNVNEVYKQVAIGFTQKGSVSYIDETDWLDISDVNDFEEFEQMCSSNWNTGGIEMYFVDSIIGANGLNYSPNNKNAGCAIAKSGNFRTAAHELGHACGLDDIYINKDGTSLGNDIVKESWAPKDWNNGKSPAYYDQSLKQRDLVLRLLMYGVASSSKADISNGRIYGVDVNKNKTLVKVGLQDLDRSPTHW